VPDVLTADSERERLCAEFAATGRNHPYLAFTVNSICDRDCVFCKPRCVEDYGPKDGPLQVTDYRLIAIEAGQWGVRKAHLSGGEPTLRTDILGIIAALREGLGAEAKIGITPELSLDLDVEIDGTQVRGRLTLENASGTAYVDPETGRVVSSETRYTMSGTLTVTAAGQNIPVETTQTIETRVEQLDDVPAR
jgi:GTP 3',8-cyclase